MTLDAVHVVGAGAGFAGDRLEPAVALADAGGLDEIVLECLAERTLVQAHQARQADPERAGWDPRLVRRLTPLLPVAAARGCRIISNMGAANPRGAAREAAALASRLGLRGLRIAAVCGDDLSGRMDSVAWERRPEGQWLGANAYLGVAGIQQALAGGADVVLTGRVADSALFAAGAALAADPDSDALAGMLTVGHILECAGQLTGGNLAVPGPARLTAAELARLGFPIARVSPDGCAELSVLAGHPARLDALSCTLQLLYEVHDPGRYVTPDGCLDLGGVRFEETGHNRVRMSGARMNGAPDRLKAVGFVARPGFIADMEIAYAGQGALSRARMAAEVLDHRLDRNAPGQRRVDLVGVNAVLGAASAVAGDDPAEVRVHVSAVCDDAAMALAVEDEVYGLTLNGPAGGCSIRGERRPRFDTVSGLVDPDAVPPEVEWETAA